MEVDKKISDETMDKLKKAFNRKSVSVKPNGILDNLNLHYQNEAARHKLLDVLGDLALIGKRIRGKVIAKKPGHHINTEFAKKVSNDLLAAKRVDFIAEANYTRNSILFKRICLIIDMISARIKYRNEVS